MSAANKSDKHELCRSRTGTYPRTPLTAELFGREPFAAAATLLAHTDTLTVETAIANV